MKQTPSIFQKACKGSLAPLPSSTVVSTFARAAIKRDGTDYLTLQKGDGLVLKWTGGSAPADYMKEWRTCSTFSVDIRKRHKAGPGGKTKTGAQRSRHKKGQERRFIACVR